VQAGRLGDLAIAVAANPEASDLAGHLATLTFRELDPVSVCLHLRQIPGDSPRDNPHLVLVGQWGLTPEQEAKLILIHEEFPLPAAEALHHALPYSLTTAEITEGFPLLDLRSGPNFAAQLFIPVAVDGVAAGVLVVACHAPLGWDPEKWHFTRSVQALLSLYLRASDRLWVPVRPLASGLTTRQELTQRQRDVLSMLAEGTKLPVIAHRLGFSESTIKHDLSRAMRALGATTRRQALDRARQLGFIPGSADFTSDTLS